MCVSVCVCLLMHSVRLSSLSVSGEKTLNLTEVFITIQGETSCSVFSQLRVPQQAPTSCPLLLAPSTDLKREEVKTPATAMELVEV